MTTRSTQQPEFMRIADVTARLGRSRSFVWKQLRDKVPGFPVPVRMGGTVCWYRKEIDAYIKNLPRIELTGVGAVTPREGSRVGRPRKAA